MSEERKYQVKDEKGKIIGNIIVEGKIITIDSEDPNLTFSMLGLTSGNNYLNFGIIDNKYKTIRNEVKK